MIGVLVNAAGIIVGGIIGTLAGKNFPEKLSKAVMQVLGVFTFFLGMQGAFKGEKSLVVIAALVLGTVLGTIVDIDKYITFFGEFLKKRFAKKGNNKNFVDAFVTTSALFGIGAMAIIGSIDAGLRHDYNILFIKSTLDFVSSIAYASIMGIGVAFSSITILVLQGTMTLLAGFVRPIAENVAMMNEITCCANVLIMAIGLNMLGLTKIKVANILPSVVLTPIIFMLFIR